MQTVEMEKQHVCREFNSESNLFLQSNCSNCSKGTAEISIRYIIKVRTLLNKINLINYSRE